MIPLIDGLSSQVQNAIFIPAFLEAALSSVVVLALASGLCCGLRSASAATRHLIWFLAVASLPCLPVLSRMLPAWRAPLWSVATEARPGNQVAVSLELVPNSRPGISPRQPSLDNAASHAANRGHGTQAFATRFSGVWLALGFLAWSGGVALVLGRMVLGRLQVRGLAREARPMLAPGWPALWEEVCGLLRVRRPVRLLEAPGKVMPMTWGWWRPVVLLPAEAAQWPEERRRVVLLHEMAHVQRWDCLTQALTRMVCAFYWFNPLVWLAARRMNVEQERACDDLVLNGGCKASDYASHLVEIARSFRRVRHVTAIAMARASGLERRVTAIVDGRRNRQGAARLLAGLCAMAGVSLGLVLGARTSFSQATPEPWGRSTVGEQLKRFVVEKEAQAIAGAKAEERELLLEYRSMFAAAAKGDWLVISNVWEDLRERAPQYEGAGPKDLRLHGTAWQTMLEIWGGFGNIVMGGEKLVAFGQAIVDAVPAGAIYFGGTDPGRCVVTALQKSHVNGEPFFTLSQNPLADDTYLAYLRRMYGGRIYTPTEEDSQRCFQEYLSDAQSRLAHDRQFPNEPKQLKPEEDVRVVGGRTQVSGQVAVMAINALLAKIIFDQNPDRSFYVEESFPLDWMYPHLLPHGPILHINRQPLSRLSDDVVQRDRAYWIDAVQPLIGDWLRYDTPVREVTAFAVRTTTKAPKPDRYVPSDSAQKWASKLRSSIAGVYAWRVGKASDPIEQQRMSREADFAFRQALALCPYSPEAVFRYANLLVEEKRLEEALLVAQAAAQLQPDGTQFGNLVKELNKMARR